MRCWQVVALALVAGCGRYHFDDAGGDGGHDSMGSGPFGTPVRITELIDTLDSASPTLRADELEMFLVRRVDSSSPGDIVVTHRASTAMPWGPTSPVVELNSATDEQALHLSSDGLTLWFTSARPGGAGMHDIYRTTRPSLVASFAAPVRVVDLCSAIADSNAAVDEAELNVVMSRGATPRDLYGSQRADAAGMWSPPAVIVELSSATDEGSPELSPDGLTTYFTSDRPGSAGSSDLWTASRPTTSAPFATPVPVLGVNTAAAEYQPWVSRDGHVLYFVSDRDGTASIYRATR